MAGELTRFKREVVTGVLPRLLYKIETDKVFKQRLEDVSSILRNRPELSALYYFNHLTNGDPLLVAWVVNRAGIGRRQILAPTSYSHTDSTRAGNEKTLKYIQVVESCEAEVIRLIQDYQINNPEYGYTPELAKENYRAFLSRVKMLGKTKTPVVVAISPEGHRSDDGTLQEGKDGGVRVFGKYLSPIIYVPIGMEYLGSWTRERMNMGKRVNLTLGDYYIQETRNDYPGIEYLMRNLALALPPSMRGVYRN